MGLLSAGRNLWRLYEPLTHGGNFWRDQYLLAQWADCNMMVVHRGETHHGYTLLRRLGDACWLTKQPVTNEYLTVKFLSRRHGNELEMRKHLARECSSPLISELRDNFTVRHHLAAVDPAYEAIQFEAIVYPTTGTDLRRESETGEPSSPPSLERRLRCIRQVIKAVAELHSLGVVHGDLQPGNVALAPPTREDIERVLEQPPLEFLVIRKDGSPTPRNLPKCVTEPERIGFGDGNIQLLDFEYSFRPKPGAAYGKDSFAVGTPPPPELIGTNKRTTKPFMVDSWHLGQLIYFVLVDGYPIFRLGFGLGDDDIRDEYRQSLDDLECGRDERMNELPAKINHAFTPIIRKLLVEDPQSRLSAQELQTLDFMPDYVATV